MELLNKWAYFLQIYFTLAPLQFLGVSHEGVSTAIRNFLLFEKIHFVTTCMFEIDLCKKSEGTPGTIQPRGTLLYIIVEVGKT